MKDTSEDKVAYDLEFSKRKTIKIQVVAGGEVQVKAPTGIDKKVIQRFVDQKTPWIMEKIDHMKQVEVALNERRFSKSGTICLMGEKYRVSILENSGDVDGRVTRHKSEHQLCIHYSRQRHSEEEIITGWLKDQARTRIVEKVRGYSLLMGVEPNQIRIKDQKTRWGSCSSKDNLNFNWRLIMAPEWIIDYVIIHELCHLVHLNHSPAYWQLVENMMPDYKMRRQWLKEKGHTLVL